MAGNGVLGGGFGGGDRFIGNPRPCCTEYRIPAPGARDIRKPGGGPGATALGACPNAAALFLARRREERMGGRTMGTVVESRRSAFGETDVLQVVEVAMILFTLFLVVSSAAKAGEEELRLYSDALGLIDCESMKLEGRGKVFSVALSVSATSSSAAVGIGVRPAVEGGVKY